MSLVIPVMVVLAMGLGRRLKTIRELTTIPVDDDGKPVLDLDDPVARYQLATFLSLYRIKGDARVSELLEALNDRPVDRP